VGTREHLPVENDAVPAEPSEETGWAARVDRWRERAEEASARYQRLAKTKPLYGLPLAFLARYTARQGVLLASAAAFRMFMWTVPLALLVAGILAGIGKWRSADLSDVVKAAGVTGAASQEVVNTLSEGGRSWWVATFLGLVFFLWATRTLTRNLILVNAHIWSAPSKKRQKDIMIISLIFAGSWIGMFAAAAVVIRFDVVPGGPFIAIAAQTAAVGALWLFLSLRLPDHPRHWTDLIPGSLLRAGRDAHSESVLPPGAARALVGAVRLARPGRGDAGLAADRRPTGGGLRCAQLRVHGIPVPRFARPGG